MIFSPNERYVAAYSLFLALLASPAISAGDAVKSLHDNSTLTTRIESEWAVLTNSGDTQKLQLMIEPELETTVGDDSSITTIVRLRTDAKDNLSPGDHNQAELREFYLDTRVGDSIVMLGKQQVVWGKSDGLKVLDIVNPQDFREFILDDFVLHRVDASRLIQMFHDPF